MLGDQSVLDPEEVERGEVGRDAAPGDGAVQDRLLDATRLFSATICVWIARPSGSAPRLTAIALTNAARPSGVQPEFWM